MTSDKPTVVDMDDSKPWAADVAQVEAALSQVREVEAWAAFGTIGFDGYVEWIQNNGVRCNLPLE